MAYPVLAVANKILAYGASAASGELVSNLKLQKLLYYVQGFHLAAFGEPLFEEEIEAWMYGPVVPSVYDHYQEYGNKGIEPEDKVLELSPKEEALFAEVLRVYGDYSAIGLMNLTHNESPWKSTPEGRGNVIDKEKLRSFFKTRIS